MSNHRLHAVGAVFVVILALVLWPLWTGRASEIVGSAQATFATDCLTAALEAVDGGGDYYPVASVVTVVPLPGGGCRLDGSVGFVLRDPNQIYLGWISR